MRGGQDEYKIEPIGTEGWYNEYTAGTRNTRKHLVFASTSRVRARTVGAMGRSKRQSAPWSTPGPPPAHASKRQGRGAKGFLSSMRNSARGELVSLAVSSLVNV